MNDLNLPKYLQDLLDTSRSGMGAGDTTGGLQTSLQGIADAGIAAGIADMVAVTERRGQQVETILASHNTVSKADQAQYEFNEGPCIQAAYEDGLLYSEDLSAETRWPRWAPTAWSLGVRAVLSVQLYNDSHRLGALNLYSTRTRQYGHEELTMARYIATNASLVLAHFRRDENL
ncbi:GAF domain-containing protein [Nakamurella sp. YIM 132087]|uniref:GAF domain-containing protein n=1 Tax=Nakamurella alba TaxID=2665158 RepID=A0A7K1FXD5_9ACTN|nr:GAF domain-containing protein [Nakamurella alba]MTD17494.1 GAF domain-containing protein [Nakamurella alba]